MSEFCRQKTFGVYAQFSGCSFGYFAIFQFVYIIFFHFYSFVHIIYADRETYQVCRHLKNLLFIPDAKAGQLGSNRKTPHLFQTYGLDSWQATVKSAHKKNAELLFAAPFFVGDRYSLKNYTKEEALAIISNAVREYDIKFKNYQFLIAFNGRSGIEFSIVGFRANNFMHFTGLKSSLPANVFYHRLINHALSPKDFDFDTFGNAQRKLTVLPFLQSLFYNCALRGIFNRSGIWLEADYVVGDTAGVFSVAFRNGSKYDFPVSLYKEDVRKLTIDTTNVLAVWRRKFGEKDFIENTYHAKEIDPNELLKLVEGK